MQITQLALPKSLMAKKALLRILILTLLFTASESLVLWDYYRVERDFSELKALLQNTRYRAIREDEILVVRFSGKEVVVTDRKTGKVISSVIPEPGILPAELKKALIS